MQRLSVVDGLRGYAMLGVLHSHTFLRLWTPKGTGMFMLAGIPIFPLTLFSNAWMGVSLFFILSGFVLALPFAEGRRKMCTMRDLGLYYRHRASRLIPVYWAVMIPVMLMRRMWENAESFVYDSAFVLTGAGAFHPTLWKPWYYSIVWTLQVEIIFSILMPLFFVIMRRYGVLRPLVCIILCGIASHTFAQLQTAPDAAEFWMHSITGSLPDFVAGMAVAYWYAERPTLTRRGWLWFVGLLFVYVSFSMKDAVMLHIIARPGMIFTETLFTVGMSLLLLLAITSSAQWVRIFLANRPMRLAGMMCYSLYLHHYWLIKVVRPVESLERLVVYCVLLFGCSWLTYRFIEFPTRDWRALLPEKVTKDSAILPVP